VTPVLEFSEVLCHPHNRTRASFIEVDGVVQPAPAPRFLGTPSEPPRPAPRRCEHSAAALSQRGFSSSDVSRLRELGAGFMAEAEPLST
jgi:alpha-methylacyl-CoA racemase